ncbi:MAG: Hpt domain-containing protein [Faecousia sp.]
MTIQECYQKLDGDFAQVEKRLSSENIVKRFITKFLDDGSFSQLCIALEEGNRHKAFHAAHTLKGVSGNLSLSRLYSSVSQLAELLRSEAEVIPAGVYSLFEEVTQDYQLTVSAIRTFLDSDHR